MKKSTSFLILLFSLQVAIGQNELQAFDNLVNSTWISEGEQLGGHDGKTVKEFSYGLDGKMIKVKTYTTDPKTLDFGLRNEGVRFFNTQSNEIAFYEFDKLGTVSKGVVKVDGKNLYYRYEYGEYTLQDSWTYVSKDEYQYQVCSLKEEVCDQVYHQGTFVRER